MDLLEDTHARLERRAFAELTEGAEPELTRSLVWHHDDDDSSSRQPGPAIAQPIPVPPGRSVPSLSIRSSVGHGLSKQWF